MQSPTHTPARDHDPPWSAEAKPAKRAKKKPAAKKSAAKKSAAKKSATKKSPAKTATKKSPAKNSGAKKKSSAERPLTSGALGISLSPEQLAARLDDPATLRRVVDALQGAPPSTEPVTGTTTGLRRDIAALEREVADLRHELAELTHRLTAMTSTVDSLAASGALALLSDEVLEDPFAWIRRDPSIIQYQGQHVALHPTRGVVAHGPRLDAMMAELRASDVSLDDIVLDFIADSPF